MAKIEDWEPIEWERLHTVNCLFEQSGTFKNVFRQMGKEAFDFDIEKKSKEVDFSLNIFDEIDNYFENKKSIFDLWGETDLCFAFFPCTYFSDQSAMVCRTDNNKMRDWEPLRKLDFSISNMKLRATYFEELCKLCKIALCQDFPLIIENPMGRPGFLKSYFPLKAEIQLNDRRVAGDYLKKPTQFFFVNCRASFNLLREFEFDKKMKRIEDIHGFDRSRISPAFAENFINTFIKGA